MRNLTLVLGLALSCGGCATAVSIYARATAGHVGCSAEGIEIRGAQDDVSGPRSWVALCGGKQYACTSSGALEDNRSRVTCAEVGGAEPEAAKP